MRNSYAASTLRAHLAETRLTVYRQPYISLRNVAGLWSVELVVQYRTGMLFTASVIHQKLLEVNCSFCAFVVDRSACCVIVYESTHRTQIDGAPPALHFISQCCRALAR